MEGLVSIGSGNYRLSAQHEPAATAAAVAKAKATAAASAKLFALAQFEAHKVVADCARQGKRFCKSHTDRVSIGHTNR